jgi:hypothetical protein
VLSSTASIVHRPTMVELRWRARPSFRESLRRMFAGVPRIYTSSVHRAAS